MRRLGWGAMRSFFLLAFSVLLAWFYKFYKALQPPPPTLCGTPSGPPVTALRLRLHDGRFLAYKELGVPKEQANHKIVHVHGILGSRHDILPVSKSVIEELGIYFVGFDRAGYGQSDPNPGRTLIKSEALDIQELADILELGPKFYVVSSSIGGYSAWAMIRYIPQRLAGVAMLCPVTNYWWPGIPFKEAFKAFRLQPGRDQVATSVAHYTPWLTYLWNTQRLFPRSSVVDRKLDFLNALDKDILKRRQSSSPEGGSLHEPIQQGVYESVFCDMNNMFGRWDFDPGDLKNPFPNRKGSIHIWHGSQDYLVPLMLQKYVHRRLPWVHLHEIPEAGHLLRLVEGLPDQVVRALLVKEA